MNQTKIDNFYNKIRLIKMKNELENHQIVTRNIFKSPNFTKHQTGF